MGRRTLRTVSVLVLAGVSLGSTPQGEPSRERPDRAFAEASALADPVERARALVEILYRAGDLPGAFREAKIGLVGRPDDLQLLRRTLQLQTALRIEAGARERGRRLQAAVAEAGLDVEARNRWEVEARDLAAEVARLEERGQALDRANARARIVAVLLLAALTVLGLVLAASGSEAAQPRRPPNRSS
jgi:hypothetical protein